MSTITRMWLGFAALCTGIIHLALIGSSPVGIAIPLAIIGAAECTWGLLAFVRGRVPLPRLALFGSIAPVLLWGALVSLAVVAGQPGIASYLGFEAMALASVLGLFIAAVLAIHTRRGTDFGKPTRAITAPRYLAGVILGGMLAAAIVTPALAATDAGKYATPMDSMPGMSLGAATSLVLHPSP
jgi:hypothetical protein